MTIVTDRSAVGPMRGFLTCPVAIFLAVLAISPNRANAGPTVSLLVADPQLAGVYDVATDGVNLFASAEGGRVLSMTLGGNNLTQLYQVGGRAQAITTLGNRLFWIDPEAGPVTDTRIFSAPKDGSGPVSAIYTGSSVGQPIVDGFGIATNGSRLFTADGVQGRVHGLNADGGMLAQLGPNRYGGFFDNNHGNTLEALLGRVFVADSGFPGVIDPQVAAISALGGSAFTTLHAGAPFVTPTGITVGEDSLYIFDPGANHSIWSLPITAGIPSLVVSDPRLGTLGGIQYWDHGLFVADYEGGAIWRIDLDPLTPVQPVPEPSSWAAWFAGMLGLCGYSWRRMRSR
jgi:hypothetical protein